MPAKTIFRAGAGLPEGYGFRNAESDEIDVVVDLRMAFLKDLHAPAAGEKGEDLRELNAVWLQQAMTDGRYRAYFVENRDRVVGGCGMLLINKPPVAGRPYRIEGLVLNVYVAPDHRKKGIAWGMMTAVVSDARLFGADRLVLHTTPAAEKLYRGMGFYTPEEPELFLDISQETNG